MKETASATAPYFVDESGDGVLFTARGQLALQQAEGVPTFMLGLLHLPDPEALGAELSRHLAAEPVQLPIGHLLPGTKQGWLSTHPAKYLLHILYQHVPTLLSADCSAAMKAAMTSGAE